MANDVKGFEKKGENSCIAVMNTPEVSKTETIVSAAEKVIYNCKLCLYSTAKKANWYKHKKAHVDFKPHQCPHCPYQSKTASNMTRHIRTHEGTKTFQCEVCGAKFNQNNNLKRHVKKQHETKSFSCGKCEQFYDSIESLTQHMSISHTSVPGVIDSINKVGQIIIQCSDKKYVCNKCNKSFNTFQEYQQHKKIHLSGAELVFYCETCCFITDCESRLKRHHLTHTQEKPFKCEYCSYCSNQKVHVDRHCLSKHNKQILNEQTEECTKANETLLGSQQMSSQVSSHTKIKFVNQGTYDANGLLEQNQSLVPQSNTSKDDDTFKSSTNNDIIKVNDNKAIHVTNDNNSIDGSNRTLMDSNCLDYLAPSKSLTDQHDKDQNLINGHSSTFGKLIEYKNYKILKIPTNKFMKSKSIAATGGSTKLKSGENQANVSKPKGHKNYRQAQKQFGCNLCSMQFHLLRSLYKHIHGQHTDYCNDINKLRCVICPYVAIHKKTLYTHMRQHTYYRNMEIDSTNMIKSQFVCIECDLVLSGKHVLETHQKTCHNVVTTSFAQTQPADAETSVEVQRTVMLDTENKTKQTLLADNNVLDSEHKEAVKAILNTS